MSVPKRLTFVTLNDQFLQVDGLADGVTGALISNATGTATLYDSTGTAVTQFQNVAFQATGTAGQYRASVPNSFNPTTGSAYTVKIDMATGTSHLHIEIAVTVAIRKT